jgi:hypothetical protein
LVKTRATVTKKLPTEKEKAISHAYIGRTYEEVLHFLTLDIMAAPDRFFTCYLLVRKLATDEQWGQ